MKGQVMRIAILGLVSLAMFALACEAPKQTPKKASANSAAENNNDGDDDSVDPGDDDPFASTPSNTPVGADKDSDGIVTLAHPDMFFSGGTLIMDHGYGVSSTFIHLHKVLVKPGDVVKAGDVVAQVGATGRATGPHLDWRINWFDVRIDPATVVPPMAEVMAKQP